MTRPPSSKVNRIGEKRLFDGYFKLDEIVVSHDFDGTPTPPKAWQVFDRRNAKEGIQGDAAAALLFDPERRNVILVQQFRAPVLGRDPLTDLSTGWMLETAAGMIKIFGKDGDPPEVRREESPKDCIQREVLDETGYQVTNLDPIATFYASPGCSRERVHLFYAEVRATDRIAPGGGLAGEGEFVKVVPIPEREFLAKLADGQFDDPKIIISGQWFKERRARTSAESDRDKSRTIKFRLRSDPRRIVGIKTGDILATTDAHMWVNPENNFMMMDRFSGSTVSAAIRRAGATKDASRATIIADTIGKDLAAKLDKRSKVDIGTVIDTTSGELRQTHKVDMIFHVATAEGDIDPALMQGTRIDLLELCVDKVLEAAERSNLSQRFRSILFPLLGTGAGGRPVNQVASKLVQRAIAYHERGTRAAVPEVYFLAYSHGDEDELISYMKRSDKLMPESGAAQSADAGKPAMRGLLDGLRKFRRVSL